MIYNDKNTTLLVSPCLLCGKDVPVSMWGNVTPVCSECKQAIAWAKEQMKEKSDE